MLAYLFKILRKIFSQSARNQLKIKLFKLRNKNKKLLQLIHGTTDDEMLFNHIIKKLDLNYDILMIHSSLNDMVPMFVGNLNQLLNKIVGYCKENQITLVMPSFFFGKDTYDLGTYYKENHFDVKKTISQMGLLTELFRRKSGVKRSIHPTHSVCAYGLLAEEITKGHHLADTSFGEGTPFGFMAQYRTMILGLGTRYFRVLTQVHTAEDMLKEEFPIKFNTKEIISVMCKNERGEELNYSLRNTKQEYIRDARLIKRIIDKKIIKWKYKGIPMFLTEAKVITDTLSEAALNGETIYIKKK